MAGRPQTTVFVSGLASSSNEGTLLQYFSPFGEVIDVQLPKQRTAESSSHGQPAAPTALDGQSGEDQLQQMQLIDQSQQPHRGFGFVVFAAEDEAEDAIDNMNLNEIEGRIVNVSLARPAAGRGVLGEPARRAIWEDEVCCRVTTRAKIACLPSPLSRPPNIGLDQRAWRRSRCSSAKYSARRR